MPRPRLVADNDVFDDAAPTGDQREGHQSRHADDRSRIARNEEIHAGCIDHCLHAAGVERGRR